MRLSILILPATLLALSACQTTTSADFDGGTGNAYFNTTNAGLPPPPGRTASDRASRRSYYMGPRGHEF